MLELFVDNWAVGLIWAGSAGGAYAIGYGLGYNAAARRANAVFGHMLAACEDWSERAMLKRVLKVARAKVGEVDERG